MGRELTEEALRESEGRHRDVTETKRADKAETWLLHELGERVKELSCLYSVSRLVSQTDEPLDAVLQHTVDLIPSALQQPKDCCARIIFEGRKLRTRKFKETRQKLSADIEVSGSKAGSVEVYYLGKKGRSSEEPFIPQEDDLIEAIARELQNVIERRLAEESLREAKDGLEARVRKRTRQLLKANRSLRVEVRERKQAEQKLKKAIKRIETHDKAKSEFVSNVSHELRTPLSSMSYALENLEKGVVGPLSGRAKSYVTMLREDCERLKGTVNEILDLSRLEAKAMVLRRVRLPFGRFVKQTVEALVLQAETKRVRITVSVDDGRGFVEFDPQKMGRGILNVIHNAIKFTPEGGTIDITVRVDTPDSGFVTLEVVDSGIGIDPRYVERVTDRYFRAGEQVTGTGLGLALCKEILELHGGRIELKSPPPGRDTGTQVSLVLPRASSLTVLVVGTGDAGSCRLREQLSAHSYEVITGVDGPHVYTSLQKREADILVADLAEAPCAVEILAQVKADDELQHLPVLAVTGADLDAAHRETLEGFGIPVLGSAWREEELIRRLEEAVLANRHFQRA